MRITRTIDKSLAYSEDNGQSWRWVSSNNFVPKDILAREKVPHDPIAHERAYQAHLDKVLGAYRQAMANHEPSLEEQFEMRAAFGAGQTVVNVITGKKYRT
jgi:hypothetical protein